MTSREIKALEIAARMRVVREGEAWSVPSQTTGAKYRVDPDAPSCTCEDFQLHREPCKHILAVRIVVEREKGTEPPAPAPDPEAKPHTRKPTYPQDWPAYVRAQSIEKHRFCVLLHDLCRGVSDPPRLKTGRKPVPLADALFVCAYKVWSGLSGRRFNSDLSDAHDAGQLSRAVHPHKISAFMENPDLTPILRDLIAESARPLAAVETDFAPDSSAFSSHKFIRWFDVKHGKTKSEHVWVKVQMMCGVKTNVVTWATVCEQDGPDSPYLPQLVQETASNGFLMREVAADKGYSSVYGHEAVEAVGATPFISFKVNATGDSDSSHGVWARMFHYFQYRRDEFLRHYHKRSNAESVFSAVKRKFGDSLRSKARSAMVNEVLCKLLCHNIVVLIHEQEELGIVPVFWGDGSLGEVSILPFPLRG